MSESELPQAQFNGWARVEVMGHQTHIGYVRTEVYGAAVLFRVDTPELPEGREYTLTEPDWSSGRLVPAGAVVKRAARPGVSVLIGAGSIYRIIPCTQEAALLAIEQNTRAALQVVGCAASIALINGEAEREELEESDEL